MEDNNNVELASAAAESQPLLQNGDAMTSYDSHHGGLHAKLKSALDEDEYHRRRNDFDQVDDFCFERLPSLQQRRKEYRQLDASDHKLLFGTKASWWNISAFWIWLSHGTRDPNPILRNSLKSVTHQFGSGISSFFYDWRWLLMTHVGVWIIWFSFVILEWLISPPRFADSDPPYANFWDRKDLTFDALYTGTNTKSTKLKVFEDSFFFYTGYVAKMGQNKTYPMGAMWVMCLLGSVLIIFLSINHRLIAALRRRIFDPSVQELMLSMDATSDGAKDIGVEAGSIILGSLDHSCMHAHAQKDFAASLCIRLAGLLAGKFRDSAYPVHLMMGKEVFELRCRSDKLEEFRSGAISSLSECVFDPEVVYRRKLAPGIAHEVADDETLRSCLDEFKKDNPNIDAPAQGASTENQQSVSREATECILKHGEFWTIPYASEQTVRIASGEWMPSQSWYDLAEEHKGQLRPACVFMLRHGEQESTGNRLKQLVGIFLTGICFGLSGMGVYGITHYGTQIASWWAYGPAVLLAIIQQVIPVVVKFIVQLEGWTSDELIMRWTLGRVYMLKMANVAVLVYQLEQLGKQSNKCVSVEVALFLYNLVLTSGFMNMAINLIVYYVLYRLAGRERVAFDHQTVAQSYIDLNYTVVLVWIGMTVSPMLPFVAALLGFFELKLMVKTISWFCKPGANPFQATPSTKMTVMMLFLATFGIACWPICMFLYQRPTALYTVSKAVTYKSYCGPIHTTERRYEAFVDMLIGWAPPVKDAMQYFSNPVVLLGLVAVLAVLIAWNCQAADMVRKECADSYLGQSNVTKHLRKRRIENKILEREKALLQAKVLQLTEEIASAPKAPAGGLSASQQQPATSGLNGQMDIEGQRKGGWKVGCFG